MRLSNQILNLGEISLFHLLYLGISIKVIIKINLRVSSASIIMTHRGNLLLFQHGPVNGFEEIMINNILEFTLATA